MGGLHHNSGNVHAIILAGGRDFGRCPLASLLPPSLWPLQGSPVLLRLLNHLADEGVKSAVVCGGQDLKIYQDAIDFLPNIEISLLKEPLPIGTAGCLRDAAGDESNQTLLIFHGSIISPPPIDWLLMAHSDARSDLTVILNPSHGCHDNAEFAGIYVCGREVLKCIPKEGYCDIKEGLIPSLWRAGKSVRVAMLEKSSGIFRNGEEYLLAVFESMQAGNFIHERAQVSSTARISGAVTIMEDAVVCDDAIIIGPTIIEKKVVVESDAIISNSVLLAGARIGKNAMINKCLVWHDTIVPSKAVMESRPLAGKMSGFATILKKCAVLINENISIVRSWISSAVAQFERHVPYAANIERSIAKVEDWLWFAVLFAAFFWLYRPEISQLCEIWLKSDEYSSGLLVPLFAAYILWSHRKQLKNLSSRPLKAGLALFFLAQAVRFFGLLFMYDSAQRLSLVLSAAAIVLYLFGWQLFYQILPILLFLLLMLPIPASVQNDIMAPLQNWATSSAVFLLEIMGIGVWREGNIIYLPDATVAVAEACNGLRMITAFFVISGLVVLLVERPWWEKLVVFLSALPIGLFCNALRLTITALAFTVLKGPFWEKAFHDFGGLAMMPMALGIIIFELWILKRLAIAPEYEAQMA